MRKLLAVTVALGPLCWAQLAVAETVISNERTTPVRTSTANNGAADDVRVATNGRVTLTGGGTAVTLDSDNKVHLQGPIAVTNGAAGSTGLLIEGGNTGDVTLDGAINLLEDYEPADTDNDGIPDGPFAQGSQRYGVRVVGATPFTGNIRMNGGGTITVEGNQSYGVFVEAGLIGELRLSGNVKITGDQSYGFRNTGAITGNVELGGLITAQGQGSSAASIEGDVGGSLRIVGNMVATGFREVDRRPNPADQSKFNLAGERLIGGPAVRVAADVDGGLIITRSVPGQNGGAPTGTTGTVFSYGSAPGLIIGSQTRVINLGLVGTGDEAFGFILNGEVGALGVLNGISALALQIGDGQATVIEGGVRVSGVIRSGAWDANATAVVFGQGADTPVFNNSGNITADSLAVGAAAGATAMRIEAGANLPSIVNSGIIRGGYMGDQATGAVGIVDLSGTLTSIDNTGAILAERNILLGQLPGAPEANAVAIDVSANTTGVTIVQRAPAVQGAAPAEIRGHIRFGSGADFLDLRSGSVTGDVNFGAGNDRLEITGGAVLRGALSKGAGDLDVVVANGTLDARQTATVNLTSLVVGADGDLIVSVDPLNAAAPRLNVNGSATLADGAGLGIRLTSLLTNPEQFTLIRADTLTVGTLDLTRLQSNTPYLYVAQAGVDQAGGRLYVDVRRRTASEAGMIASEAAALDAVFGALGQDAALRGAVLEQVSRGGFMNIYEQLLPDHSGATLTTLANGVDAVSRALSDQRPGGVQGETTAWLQEINFYADKAKGDSYGFRTEGFGVAGGVERGTDAGAFGLSFAFATGDSRDPEAEGDESLSAQLIEVGVYWRHSGENWRTWARAAGGHAKFDSVRRVIGSGLNYRNESTWNGYSLAAGAGASYEHRMGRRYYLRPEATTDYFYLSEDGRTETGDAGTALQVEGRDGHLWTAAAVLNVGGRFGEMGWLQPEVRLGWRQYLSYDPGRTTARFVSGGAPFALTADTIDGGGPILGFRLLANGQMGFLALEGDAELLDGWERYVLMIRAGFRF